MANTLPGHLRCLDEGPDTLQDQPAPPHPGTTHVGAAGAPAEAGILRGADETEADPVPIADPLRAAAEIDREEEERGRVWASTPPEAARAYLR